MSSKERLFYWLAIAALAGLSIVLFWRAAGAARLAADQRRREAALSAEAERLRADVARLREEVARLNDENARLKDENAHLRGRLGAAQAPAVLLTEAQLADLRSRGLKDPVADLISDLERRSDLPPVRGVLGGTTRFRPSDRWVITRRWVLASYDDGHIGGMALLRYEVRGGRITWTLLDHDPD